MAAYLLLRGMKTLHLRVRQQNDSAMAIAHFLEDHPAVELCLYPGLPQPREPRHRRPADARLRRHAQLLRRSAAFDAVRRILPGCATPTPPPTWARSRPSSARRPRPATSRCTADQRAALGIPEGLIRYSTGIEETSDLIADLEQALG